MYWREIVVVILTGFVVKLMFIREIAEMQIKYRKKNILGIRY